MKLKLLYSLCLVALCLYVVSGPAKAIQITSPFVESGWTSLGSSSGNPDVSVGNLFVSNAASLIKLDGVDVECPPGGGSCMAEVNFGFVGMDYPAQNTMTVTLNGYTSSPNVTGYVSINNPVSLQTPLTVNGTQLSMNQLQFGMSGPSWYLSGAFVITSMSPGSTVEWGETSLDFNLGAPDNTVPEPATAATLVAGVALVEFLRRKRSRQTH